MKLKLLVIFLSVLSFMQCSTSKKQISDEQVYGQKPPGTTPEIYQPDFKFLGDVKPDFFTISPDGNEFCYSAKNPNSKARYDRFLIYYLKKENGKWSKPELAYFVPDSGQGGLPQFSPDGKQFSYTFKGDLYISSKESGMWTTAEKYPEPINSEKYECGFSFVKSSNFYFAANGRPEGKSKQCDIYCCSKNSNNAFGPAVNLSNVNTERSECVLAADPDEKYIIFTRYFNKSGNNAVDLFITFHKKDGSWTEAQRLEPPINSPGSNHSPRLSTDGKYFFFSQTPLGEKDNSNTKNYWVSTIMFDELRKSFL